MAADEETAVSSEEEKEEEITHTTQIQRAQAEADLAASLLQTDIDVEDTIKSDIAERTRKAAEERAITERLATEE